MKSYTEYLWFNTPERFQIINITDKVQEIVTKSKIKEGFALVSAMHTSSSVYVSDDESGLKRDFQDFLDVLLPPDPKRYKHQHGADSNGDAHLRSILIHHESIVPVTNGKLDLGPWQQIFYGEFDGRRKIIGE